MIGAAGIRRRTAARAAGYWLALALPVWGGGAFAQHAHGHDHHAHGAQEGDGRAHHDHGAEGQAGTAPVAAAGPPGPVLYAAEDLHFLHHMIVHHEQALAMAALVPGRTGRAELQRFARLIEAAQRAEIRMMRGMLDMARARDLSVPAHDHAQHGDPPMAGMLSLAEMAALEGAEGAAFERLWLEGMIFHHEGGLAMARAQQLLQAQHGRRPHGLETLVEDILIEQRVEIAQMQAWLAELAPGANSRRAPAAEVTSPPPGAALPAGREAMLFGLAIGDARIEAVRVGIENRDTGQWLGPDQVWGERAFHDAEIVRSGPAGGAWRLAATPPAPGVYAIHLEAEDESGARAEGAAPHLFRAD